MRTKVKVAGFSVLLFTASVLSCSDENEQAPLSDAAKGYLSMRLGSANAMSQNMTGAINNSFNGIFSNFGRPNGRLLNGDDSTEVPPDTTIIDPGQWQSCAVISEVNNEDGSHTTIYDYGDGCEEGWGDYTYFMHGKMMYTWLSQFSQSGSVYKNSFFYLYDYDNYGGNYGGQWAWVMDGNGSFQGESEYDTATNKFKGAYSYADETTYTYDSTTYSYVGNGTTVYTEKHYTIKSSQYTYTTGDDYYKQKVLKPLVVDYDCYTSRWATTEQFCWFPVYVSGRERVQYKQGDEEGSFEIDYGNGECDNIITIYENGKITVIDLGELWK